MLKFIKPYLKVKVYKVILKDNPHIWYLVDAPSKRVAKWQGAAICNNEYATFKLAKDFKIEKFKV